MSIKRVFQSGAAGIFREISLFILSLFVLFFSMTSPAGDCTPAPIEVGGDISLRLPFRVGEQYPVTQGYCDGSHTKGYEVDFAIPTGTPIVAVSAGTVVQLGTYAGTCTDLDTKCGLNGLDQGGLFVKLQHPCSEPGQAWFSSYLHLSVQSVTLGQTVAAGEVIGLSGNTGLSTGPHLHFHIRKGPADNPLNDLQNHIGVRPTPMTGLETNTAANPITDFTVNFWYQATGSPAFSVGDSIQVISRTVQGLSGLPVRSDACGTQIAAKADGEAGIIIGGPTFCEGYNRWQIRWSDGVEGWSGQNWLRTTADPCAGTSISPLSRSHGAGVETGSVTVTAGNGCAWTATPSAGWISIPSGATSSGNGMVNYSLSANASTATRHGNISVAGKTFAITQSGTIPVSATMSHIPAGSFTMGNCMASSEGQPDELPLHTVDVSAFYMDKTEVTKALWDEVYQWAIAHGYSFDNAGSGKAANHPVHTVNWYDMVKWCNARSEKAGLVPAYYTSATQTTVYRTGQVDVRNDWVKWNAGYRLPTEAEWEKAARGGVSGHRFPWSNVDTISHSQANYYSDNYSYDASPTRGYHPTFNDGVDPYTSPVGYFAANSFGLYDMTGNVWEWCWDRYDAAYYSSLSQVDPRGASSGSYRVVRGGSWFTSTDHDRCSYRINGEWIAEYVPTYADSHRGFRCVLSDYEDSQTHIIDINSGLVAYYPFDGNANDASGNEKHATVANGVSYGSGVHGEAIVVAPAVELSPVQVRLPTFPFATMSQFSISVWVREDTLNQNDGESYVWFGDHTYGWVGIGRIKPRSSASGPALSFSVGARYNSVEPLLGPWNPSDQHRFVHYALVYSDGMVTGFKDGECVGSLSQSVEVGSAQASVGTHWANNNWWSSRLGAAVDQLRIYNRALSAAEVGQLYASVDIVHASSPATVPPPTQVPTPTVPPRQPAENNLIVITHGYQPGWVLADAAWVDTMADAIRADLQRRGLNNWQVVPIKWTEAAGGIPATALTGARITGALYGAQFAQQHWQHIHLIGHSAGSVFIESFAKEIKGIWPATTIHSTFLDPYLSVIWGLGLSTYGNNSDWADCYFANDNLTSFLTEGRLENAHNANVTWLDPAKTVTPIDCGGTYMPAAPGSTSPYYVPNYCGENAASSHGWPVDFYLSTIQGTAPAAAAGYGFPLSLEAGGWTGRSSFPVNNEPVVLGGPLPVVQRALPQRTDAMFQIDQLSYDASDTGAELFGRGLKLSAVAAAMSQHFKSAISLPAGTVPQATRLIFTGTVSGTTNYETGDPSSLSSSTNFSAWLAMGLTVTNAVNFVTFDAGFSSTNGAEGLLTVYWNTNLLGAVDERVTDRNLHNQRFALPGIVTNGLHVLGFRLDSFNGTASSVTVTNVATGFAGITTPLMLQVMPPNTNSVPLLKLTGASNFTYMVQFSTNLTSWTPVATLVNSNGISYFADPAVTNSGRRFYRALSP